MSLATCSDVNKDLNAKDQDQDQDFSTRTRTRTRTNITGHMGSYSVTFHPTQVNSPHLTLARQAGTRFTYPGWMEGWVDLGEWLHTEMVYPPADGHPPIINGSGLDKMAA